MPGFEGNGMPDPPSVDPRARMAKGAYSPSEPLIRPRLSTAERYATATRGTILASRRVPRTVFGEAGIPTYH